jgi:hypothetical protein
MKHFNIGYAWLLPSVLALLPRMVAAQDAASTRVPSSSVWTMSRMIPRLAWFAHRCNRAHRLASKLRSIYAVFS